MPPKQRITREMILEKAYAMFCQDGMEIINARSVAKALNCSTQPIFSYYSGMQELKDTLDLEAQKMFEASITAVAQSDTWLVDVYCAYIQFAVAYPHVYEHLFDRACADNARMDAFKPLLSALISHVQQKDQLTSEQAARLCAEIGVYAEGLASLCMMQGAAKADDIRSKLLFAESALRAAL